MNNSIGRFFIHRHETDKSNAVFLSRHQCMHNAFISVLRFKSVWFISVMSADEKWPDILDQNPLRNQWLAVRSYDYCLCTQFIQRSDDICYCLPRALCGYTRQKLRCSKTVLPLLSTRTKNMLIIIWHFKSLKFCVNGFYPYKTRCLCMLSAQLFVDRNFKSSQHQI